MDYSAFFEAIFEMVDLWCHELQASAYVEFLHDLQRKLATEKVRLLADGRQAGPRPDDGGRPCERMCVRVGATLRLGSCECVRACMEGRPCVGACVRVCACACVCARALAT